MCYISHWSSFGHTTWSFVHCLKCCLYILWQLVNGLETSSVPMRRWRSKQGGEHTMAAAGEDFHLYLDWLCRLCLWFDKVLPFIVMFLAWFLYWSSETQCQQLELHYMASSGDVFLFLGILFIYIGFQHFILYFINYHFTC